MQTGLGIKKHTLDNEASDVFKQYIHTSKKSSLSWCHQATIDATKRMAAEMT
jgi:hypothetical protein